MINYCTKKKWKFGAHSSFRSQNRKKNFYQMAPQAKYNYLLTFSVVVALKVVVVVLLQFQFCSIFCVEKNIKKKWRKFHKGNHTYIILLFSNKTNFNIKLPIAWYDKIQHTFNQEREFMWRTKKNYEEMNELFHTNTMITFFYNIYSMALKLFS